MMESIQTQVKGILTDSAARIEELTDRGRKVAGDVRARVEEKALKGSGLLKGWFDDISPKDLLDRFGTMKLPELIERLKSADISHQTDALRNELMTALRLPSTDTLDRLEVSIQKLSREVAAMKGLKADVKELANDVRKLATDVRTLKTAPKATAAKEPTTKANARKANV